MTQSSKFLCEKAVLQLKVPRSSQRQAEPPKIGTLRLLGSMDLTIWIMAETQLDFLEKPIKPLSKIIKSRSILRDLPMITNDGRYEILTRAPF